MQQCQYQADAGLVCPIIEQSSLYQITTFQECSASIQQQVTRHLQSEWGNKYNNSFITRHWSTGDILYVMLNRGELIGCMAIDRKNFFPFISQLYVVPKYRNKGYASLLLQHGEKYAASMKFSVVRLWCNKELVRFYQKRGYRVLQIQDVLYIMEKQL